jgi:hypothetical protein
MTRKTAAHVQHFPWLRNRHPEVDPASGRPFRLALSAARAVASWTTAP